MIENAIVKYNIVHKINIFLLQTTIRENIPQRSNNTFQNISRSQNASHFQYTNKYTHDRKKNLDEDKCILS